MAEVTTLFPITKKLLAEMKRQRLELGISQAQLAQKVGTTRARIKRIECGEIKRLEGKEIERLTSALKVTASRTGGGQPAAAPKKSLRDKTMKARAARAVLEQYGLLDVTVRDLLNAYETKVD